MKKSIRYLTLVLSLTASLAIAPAAQAEELSRAALLSASCEGCHGTGGRSPGAIPAIAGKSQGYLVETLESFRSGERPSTVMGRHVSGYTEDEIRQIAEYFAKQK
jgi:sulfide dehydrogenase cytochrome subunit